VGSVIRWLAAVALGAALALAAAGPVAAFDGFGTQSADSTYGREMTFTVELSGGAPDRLELLLTTPGSDAVFVAPVQARGTSATYTWDTSADHVTPNTPVTYQWRATDGDEVTVSDPGTLRYDDDRPGLDWQSANLGDATVHWYGDAETQARRFGELTAVGVQRAEDLLGTTLAGPVDVFVYQSRDDFFGALGPGAREWTGAAAFTEIRTIFMWNSDSAGDQAYLEQAMIHEVTHVVFADATDNPYHEPARWLNEGLATWAEDFDGADEAAIVRVEAAGGGLFAFPAIEAQFPIGDRGGRLSYAQGTAMIDRIVDTYGEGSLAEIAAAYRAGASDAEALEAGTGVPADQLYDDFYAAYGVDAPQPITPQPIPASNVDRPEAGPLDPGGVDTPATPPPGDGTPGQDGAPGSGDPSAPLVIGGLVLAGAAALGAALWLARRAARRSA
jgi:hypothetical protein